MNYLLQGGILMYPLLLASLIALAIIINRIRVFRQNTVDEKIFIGRVTDLIDQGSIAEAVAYCDTSRGPVARILGAGLQEYGKGLSRVQETFQTQELFEMPALEKYVSFLGTIASISTLIGFTGTVTGMIRSFNAIAQAGSSSPQIVASGIAEALITTATGLIIAIPSMIFYQYFQHRLDLFELEIERATRAVLLLLGGKK